MEFHNKHVDFGKYCKLCKYKEYDGTQDPCDHCLEQPVNVDSRKPVGFVEGENNEHNRENKNN